MREGAKWFIGGLLCLMVQVAGAQEKPRDESADLKQLQERIGKLEQELQGLRKKFDAPAVNPPQGNSLLLILENLALAPQQYGDTSGPRYLVVKFTLANQTNQAVSVNRDQLELLVDGQPQHPENVPDRLKNQSFPWGLDYVHLQRVLPFKQLRVPPGGTHGAWLFFATIPAGNNVPKLELRLKADPQPVVMNLNKVTGERLELQTEMIGPRKSLALLRIGGELNSVSLGRLIEEFERLAESKTIRVVVTWEESANPVEPQIATWLRLSAEQEDRLQASQLPFPTIPATLRTIYLVKLPSPQFQTRSVSRPNQKLLEDRFQAKEEDAVRLALEPVFARISAEELVAELKGGHPLSRAAGLATAAGRLPPEQLELVLSATKDKDPLIQQAAVRGLQHFGEESALQTLIEIIKRGQEPLASTAVESLAASRFAPMQDALLKLLANEPVKQREKMFKALAKNPRPNLAEPLYQFVSENPRGMQVELLQALEMVGHPKLTPLLERALNDNPAVATEALRILVDKNLPDADKIALKYTLQALKTQAPTPVMLRVLTRLKDPKGVPLLLAHLKTAKDPAAIVTAVGKIADPSIAPKLLEDYAKLPNTVQGAILELLRQWQAPQFRDLAHKALESGDGVLVQAAAQSLIESDGDRGIPWIGETLKQTRKPEIIQILCNILANLGSPEAREILNQVRGSGSEAHRQAAMSALVQIRSRSPGIQYLVAAQEAQEKKNYKEAIEHYTQAIKIDPELFEAYIGRADCLVRRNLLKDAGPDFQKGLELEPFNSTAFTGVCLALTVNGKLDEATTKLDEGRKLFAGDSNYFYNAACVYGRGVEYLQEAKEPPPQKEEKIKAYTGKALEDLKHSIQLGFRDFKWMKEDPDLKPFRKNPDFEKLSETPANPTPKTNAGI